MRFSAAVCFGALCVCLLLTDLASGKSHAVVRERFINAIKNTPWNKDYLKRVVKLDLEHKFASEDRPRGWEQIVAKIESDPDYLPRATQILAEMAEKIPRAGVRMTGLPTWLASSTDGKQKIYLVGTSHRAGFENLSQLATTRFGKMWDESSVVMWEGHGIWVQLIVQQLADESYLDILQGFGELDYHLLIYGLSRSNREIVRLDGSWAVVEDGVERRLDHEGVANSSDPREKNTDQQLTDNEKERYLDEIISHYEFALLEMASYIEHDMETSKSLGRQRRKLWETHRTLREQLRNDYLLDARNRLWVQKMKENAGQRGVVLVIGGVSHMIYDHEDTVSSVVTLLREDGFQVKFLPAPPAHRGM